MLQLKWAASCCTFCASSLHEVKGAFSTHTRRNLIDHDLWLEIWPQEEALVLDDGLAVASGTIGLRHLVPS